MNILVCYLYLKLNALRCKLGKSLDFWSNYSVFFVEMLCNDFSILKDLMPFHQDFIHWLFWFDFDLMVVAIIPLNKHFLLCWHIMPRFKLQLWFKGVVVAHKHLHNTIMEMINLFVFLKNLCHNPVICGSHKCISSSKNKIHVLYLLYCI